MELEKVSMLDTEGCFCHSLTFHKSGCGFWFDGEWYSCYINRIELYVVKHEQNRTYVEYIGSIENPKEGTIENVEKFEIHKGGVLKLYIKVQI